LRALVQSVESVVYPFGKIVDPNKLSEERERCARTSDKGEQMNSRD